MKAFVEAYETIGYQRCEDGVCESQFEKIAIFADAAGVPTHAARQLQDGTWTSKLGPWEDIAHQSVDGVAGAEYGAPVVFLRRPVTKEADK